MKLQITKEKQIKVYRKLLGGIDKVRMIVGSSPTDSTTVDSKSRFKSLGSEVVQFKAKTLPKISLALL